MVNDDHTSMSMSLVTTKAAPEHSTITTLTPFQRKFRSFHFPILAATEPSFRMTHSDVMCVSNSGQRCKSESESVTVSRSPSRSSRSRSSRLQLPYQELYASPKKSISNSNSQIQSQQRGNRPNTNIHTNTNTLLQEKQSTESRKNLDAKLHMEHRTFMSNLKKERLDRFKAETDAAVQIQRVLRGYGVRMPKSKSMPMLMSRSGSSMPIGEREVWEVLLHAASRVGVTTTSNMDMGMLMGFQPPPEIRDSFTII